MTKSDYFERIQKYPWSFPSVEGCVSPPQEWITEAWELDGIQSSLVYEMASEVSKNGEMFCGAEFLTNLSEALTTEQVVRLFLEIRDRSPHREAEFRPEFETAFEKHQMALPPPLTREEVKEFLGLDESAAQELLDNDPTDWFRRQG